MASLWRWIISFLVWLSADPQAIDAEAAKASAAVALARASMAHDAAPPAPAPEPQPAPGKCCGECGGRGYIVHGDGHRTACPCPADCPCKKAACPDGSCPTPGKVLR
jgi:hypothetical protein